MIMPSIKDVIQNIRLFRKKSGIAKFRLATMAGVSEGILRNMDEDGWNPTARNIKKIEIAIDKIQRDSPQLINKN